MATVYLLHFDRPLKHARHYIGYTALESVQDRLNRHKANRGAIILKVCNQQGIGYQIVRTWEFDDYLDAAHFEKRLKNQKHAPRLCPVCNRHLCNQEYSEEK